MYICICFIKCNLKKSHLDVKSVRTKALAQKYTACCGPVGSVSTSYLSVNKSINICVRSRVDAGMLCHLRSSWFHREKMESLMLFP